MLQKCIVLIADSHEYSYDTDSPSAVAGGSGAIEDTTEDASSTRVGEECCNTANGRHIYISLMCDLGLLILCGRSLYVHVPIYVH